MTNYTNLSDFEINKRVAVAAGLSNIVENAGSVFVASDCRGKNIVPVMGIFNPCNNWSDAGPIIQENYITLGYDGFSWEAFSIKWEGLHYSDWKNYPEEPLRIAMILFLMGKESKQ